MAGMPYPPNKRGTVLALASGKAERRQLHPHGDSGGIQTNDLQNFFSTKSFCSKIKRCSRLLKLRLRGYGRMPYPPNIKMCNLERLHPLVIPVGFKPTTFRTGI